MIEKVINLKRAAKFSSPAKIKELGNTWRKASTNRSYPTTRSLTKKITHDEAQEDFHHRSFTKEVIPKLLKTNAKVKILELGAGACLAVDEIRKTFPKETESGQLKVYSTGLAKDFAKEERGRNKVERLHHNDLKWRSIKELSDFPEFHLIYDTFGEVWYAGNRLTALKEFLIMICKKLLPGGFASIASIDSHDLVAAATLKYGWGYDDHKIDSILTDNEISTYLRLYGKDELKNNFERALDEIFDSIKELFAQEGNIKFSLKKTKLGGRCIEIQKAPFLFKSKTLFD